jgi:hypothetical protein
MASAVGMAAILDMPDKPALERVDLLAHGARVGDDAPRPFQHALAFRA